MRTAVAATTRPSPAAPTATQSGRARRPTKSAATSDAATSTAIDASPMFAGISSPRPRPTRPAYCQTLPGMYLPSWLLRNRASCLARTTAPRRPRTASHTQPYETTATTDARTAAVPITGRMLLRSRLVELHSCQRRNARSEISARASACDTFRPTGERRNHERVVQISSKSSLEERRTRQPATTRS